MIEVKGKYNTAKVFTNNIEDTALEQIKTVCSQEVFKDSKIRIMPDVHAGAGCVIGFTADLKDKVIPNLVGVDIGCFTGDTKIPLMDGTIKSLGELVGEEFYVYSMDENLQIVPGKAIGIKTRNEADLIEVAVSGGEVLRCTLDHKFMLINGTYKEAKDLKPLDSLMPLYRTYQTRDGYETCRSFKSKSKPTHKIVAESMLGEISKEDVVHHKDNSWWNNSPENLEIMNSSEHSRLHREKKCVFTTEEFKKKRKEKLEKNGYYSPELYNKKAKVGTDNITEYMKNNKEKWFEKIKDNGKRGSKYLSEFNKINNSTIYSCKYCGRKIKGKGGLKKHEKSCYVQENHKVLWTKQINNKEDVYCLNVDKYHNFALNAGVFVHNCGVLTTEIPLNLEDINFESLDNIIRTKIPSGFSIRKKVYGFEYNVGGDFLTEEIKRISKDLLNDDFAKHFKSIGTLGGGNHFIEVNKGIDEIYLVIHTGSRNFGWKIAQKYQKLAEETCKDDNVPKDLKYLEGELAANYLKDMKVAQEFASMNRLVIRDTIFKKLNINDTVIKDFDTVHNFIDEENVIRKGAVKALLNQKLIIPINMRDGSVICVGKGNEDWNYSSPHGAGRVLSRTKAKKSLSMGEFKNQMRKIYSTSVRESTLDESPMAYKNIHDIINNIGDTVKMEQIIKSVYNFKA